MTKTIPPIKFTVPGTPAPQGSKSAVIRGERAVVIEGSSTSGREKHTNWRAAVASGAMQWRAEHPAFEVIDGACLVSLIFHVARPANARKKVYSDKRPDLDKLIRSTLDSMSGLIYTDDSRVAALLVEKRYAESFVGCDVVVAAMDNTKEPVSA